MKCLVGLIFALLATAASAETAKLRFANIGDDREGIWLTSMKPFIDAVNTEGQGIIEIEPFLSGALGKSVSAQPQMVLDGLADIAFVIPGAIPGRFPDHSLLEWPGQFESMRQATYTYWQLANSNAIRGYQQYKVIATLGGPPYILHTRKKPVGKLGDLAGIKVRVANEADRIVLHALGAVPVLIPVNETAEAIARGTVDGAEQNPPVFYDFGFDRVTDQHYLLELGRPMLAVLMSKQKFDSLPQKAKEILDKYSGPFMMEKHLTGYGDLSAGFLQKLKSSAGHTVVVPSPEDRAAFQKVSTEQLEIWSQKDPALATAAKIVRSAAQQNR